MADFGNTEYSKAPRHTDPSVAQGVRIDPGPFIGIVKNNIDPMRAGRLQVWIPEMGGDPSDSSAWRTVTYASPFFGQTPVPKPNGKQITGQNFNTNPHSYGFWMVPPDLGVRVICTFIMGDPFRGFWFACVPEWPNMHMVPAIAGPNGPVVEYNEGPNEAANIPDFYKRQSTPHEVIAKQLSKQGLAGDKQRGAITSTSFRESPSGVFGFSSPGRLLTSPVIRATPSEGDEAEKTYERESAGRRGGHSIVMDDGDENGNNNLLRIRSSAGNQIMMNDNCGFIHLITASGRAWLELDQAGNINMYAKGQFNVKADGPMQFEGQLVKIKSNSTVDIFAPAAVKITGMAGLDLNTMAMAKLTGKAGVHVKGKDAFITGDSCVHVVGGKGVDIKGACVTVNGGSGKKAQDAGMASPTMGMPTAEPWPGHSKDCSSGGSGLGMALGAAAIGVAVNAFSSSGGYGSPSSAFPVTVGAMATGGVSGAGVSALGPTSSGSFGISGVSGVSGSSTQPANNDINFERQELPDDALGGFDNNIPNNDIPMSTTSTSIGGYTNPDVQYGGTEYSTIVNDTNYSFASNTQLSPTALTTADARIATQYAISTDTGQYNEFNTPWTDQPVTQSELTGTTEQPFGPLVTFNTVSGVTTSEVYPQGAVPVQTVIPDTTYDREFTNLGLAGDGVNSGLLAENPIPSSLQNPITSDIGIGDDNSLPSITSDIGIGDDNSLPSITSDIGIGDDNSLPPITSDIGIGDDNSLPSITGNQPAPVTPRPLDIKKAFEKPAAAC